VNRFYKDLHAKIRNEIGGIYTDCDTCKYRLNEVCMGGCIAHILNHLYNEAPVRIKEIYS